MHCILRIVVLVYLSKTSSFHGRNKEWLLNAYSTCSLKLFVIQSLSLRSLCNFATTLHIATRTEKCYLELETYTRTSNLLASNISEKMYRNSIQILREFESCMEIARGALTGGDNHHASWPMATLLTNCNMILNVSGWLLAFGFRLIFRSGFLD